MAVDEQFVERIRNVLRSRRVNTVEKRMFGGVAFMVNGNMTVGIMNDGKFMARVGKEQNEQALKMPHAKQMRFTRPMIGYITIAPEGVRSEGNLAYWVDMCLAFNATLPKK